MEEILRQYETGYMTNSTGSYFTLTVPIFDDLIFYQMQMLVHNHFLGILNTGFFRQDEKAVIYYDLTSKITLTRFLKRKTLKEHELVSILLEITSVLVNAQGYLLDDGKFVLDPDYIYINPSASNLELMYLPFKSAGNTGADTVLKSFVVRLITDMINLDENEKGSGLKKILSFLRKENFNIKEFNVFLNGMLSNEGGEFEITEQDDGSYVILDYREIREKTCENSNTQVNTDRVNIARTYTLPANSTSSLRNIPSGKSIITAKNTSSERDTFRIISPYIVLAFIQLLFTTFYFLGLQFLEQESSPSSQIGLLIIAVSLDAWLTLKVLQKRRNKGHKSSDYMKESSTESGKRLVKNIKAHKETKYKKPAINVTPELLHSNSSVQQPGNLQYTEYTDESKLNSNTVYEYNTELLYRPGTGPYLCPADDSGSDQRIPITSDSFVIGRQTDQVDFVINNMAVGKVHAEIIKKSNMNYYIIDLNSRNGTYLNSQRIDSNKEYMLHHNDSISFANSEFIFKII